MSNDSKNPIINESHEICKRISEGALIVRRYTGDDPHHVDDYELELHGEFKNEKGEITACGGHILHTGTLEQCEQVKHNARLILMAITCDTVNATLSVISNQVTRKKLVRGIHQHKPGTVLGLNGSNVTVCPTCKQMRPCACPGQRKLIV